MAKKGGGGKKSFWDNPFGGMFDFNHDGKEDFYELLIAQRIIEERTKEEQRHNYTNNGDFVDTSWREFCEDGSEFDIDPEDYDTEEEYNEALEEAKNAWRNTCENGSEYGLDPYIFDTEYEYNEALEEAKNAWRDTCENGSEYGLDPYIFDTEYEYNEALEEAKNAWHDTCEDGSEYGLDPDVFDTEDEYNEALEEAQASELDSISAPTISLQFSIGSPVLDKSEEIKEENYPNERRFNAAYALANGFFCWNGNEEERKDEACCRFIIDNADKITAANYLSYKGGFIYAQAIKDNFQLPVSLPDEDEFREYKLSDALCKIAKRNVALSFEVWEWVLNTFLPYTQYADGSLTEMTSNVIDDLYSFPENYRTELARYMNQHPDFMEKVLSPKSEMPDNLYVLITDALKDGLTDTSSMLFKCGLAQAGDDWKKINKLTGNTIYWCKNYDELESAEYFKLNLLPLVKLIDIGMVQDEIDEWEKGLDEYISQIESKCKQYAYTRKNAWRKKVPDGSKYGLDPRYYDSEQEYLAALEEEKYGWRKRYKNYDTLGLNVNDFETQNECRKAYDTRLEEKRQTEREQKERERRERVEKEQRIEAEKARVDDTIYTICGVIFPNTLHPYHYRTDDTTIKVGDEVLVPVGDKETIGKVVSVGQYMRVAAPYPVDKTKFIIEKKGETKNEE